MIQLLTKVAKENMRALALGAGLLATAGLSPLSGGASASEIAIVHKDQTFVPAEIEVKAGEAFTLKVKNEDAKVIEFESESMRVEKVISGGREAIIKVRALKPGTYEFVNEFFEKTKGKVIAK